MKTKIIKFAVILAALSTAAIPSVWIRPHLERSERQTRTNRKEVRF